MTDRAKNRGPEILTGSVTAMVCLERALRHQPIVEFDDQLERAIYEAHEAWECADPGDSAD